MEHEPVAEFPPYVPARLVNEFVYCPRFFHLAWTAGESGENELTAEGKWQHRRVDEPSGRPPTPDEPGTPRSTSVTVSSERLGVIAKVDILESVDGAVVPVELKRGRERDVEHPVWEPERVQMAVTALVLRDNGYEVPHVEVRFTDSPKRVRLELTDELVGRAERAVRELRVVGADPLPPPPLVDSPKCPACIMNTACLPDEHASIHGRLDHPPRRLVPNESSAFALYVTEPGSRVGVEGRELTIKHGRDTLARARLIDVDQLSVFGNVQVSTQALREMFFREIPVAYFSGNGWFQGLATGLPSKHVELRRRQVLLPEATQLSIARSMVRAKILNARVLLRRNSRSNVADQVAELRRLARFAVKADTMGRLLGIEGGAARVYFSRFDSMIAPRLSPDFEFTKRTRRPPTDPVNCLLSYCYGLLVKDCTTTLLTVGFDPYQGVYHRPRFGRPALALDLAEEFRPLIADSTVVTVLNNGEVNDRSFTRHGRAVGLTADGRRSVIAAYERRLATDFTHPTFKYRISYRRAIEVQARLIGAVLLGEFDSYVGVVTK